VFVPLAARATCSHEDAPYELKRIDLAYEEAMKLKESFNRQSIEVICVLPSTINHIFDGQLGAAFYRTTVGIIDVMFMPKSTDFKICVIETKKDGRYLYSFDGKVRAITPGWDASHPFFFIQIHNAMFTTDDEKMAQRLRVVVRAG
jgi:hypothetical protein